MHLVDTRIILWKRDVQFCSVDIISDILTSIIDLFVGLPTCASLTCPEF
jgi:hypothetical protein